MIPASIKQILRPMYTRCFGALLAEREKNALREKVSALPVTEEYPFDVEAKLLRSIGMMPSVMLDIGANTGFYSAIMEDIVGSDNLYVFEPLPELSRYLRTRFKKAHVFDVALSEREETGRIRVPFIDGERYDTRASLNRHVEPNQTGFEEVDVRLIPLDHIVRKLQLKSIGFVKIDVEGHELEVINGGVETISRFKPLLLVEIEARHHRCPIADIFSRVEAIGYKGYYISPEHFELLRTEQFDADRDQNQEYLRRRQFLRYLNNFFFVPESNENDFVSKAIIFLESEKAVASNAPKVKTARGDIR